MLNGNPDPEPIREKSITGDTMATHFATRMRTTPRSFIREILKVTEQPGIISFAGGLPSPSLFPIRELAAAAQSVFEDEGPSALQYSTTEGHPPLRQYIADRYRERFGLLVDPGEILITNGSQQCLDLIGKVFIDRGSTIGIERPGYLGAIQAFSLYEPLFDGITLQSDGPDAAALARACATRPVSIFYGIPNSQNPSGVTYSAEKRKEVAGVLADHDTVFVEDDAYGELRFEGSPLPPIRSYLPEQTVMLGSFSKIVAPGMRMGWICAPEEIIEQITVAKQASDLHSNYLSQRIIARYLAQNPVDDHIARIISAYRRQRDCMIALIDDLFPEGVQYTKPDGGMFLWVTLPEGCSTEELLADALRESVAFVPGSAFYVDGGGENSMRLNFSNASEEKITEGMQRLAAVIRRSVTR